MKKIYPLVAILTIAISFCTSCGKSPEEEFNTMPNETFQEFVDKELKEHPNYYGNTAVCDEIVKEFEQFLKEKDPVKVLDNIDFEAEMLVKFDDGTNTKPVMFCAMDYLLIINAEIPQEQACKIDVEKVYRVKDIAVDSVRMPSLYDGKCLSLNFGAIIASKLEFEEVPGKKSRTIKK